MFSVGNQTLQPFSVLRSHSLVPTGFNSSNKRREQELYPSISLLDSSYTCQWWSGSHLVTEVGSVSNSYVTAHLFPARGLATKLLLIPASLRNMKICLCHCSPPGPELKRQTSHLRAKVKSIALWDSFKSLMQSQGFHEKKKKPSRNESESCVLS